MFRCFIKINYRSIYWNSWLFYQYFKFAIGVEKVKFSKEKLIVVFLVLITKKNWRMRCKTINENDTLQKTGYPALSTWKMGFICVWVCSFFVFNSLLVCVLYSDLVALTSSNAQIQTMLTIDSIQVLFDQVCAISVTCAHVLCWMHKRCASYFHWAWPLLSLLQLNPWICICMHCARWLLSILSNK